MLIYVEPDIVPDKTGYSVSVQKSVAMMGDEEISRIVQDYLSNLDVEELKRGDHFDKNMLDPRLVSPKGGRRKKPVVCAVRCVCREVKAAHQARHRSSQRPGSHRATCRRSPCTQSAP